MNFSDVISIIYCFEIYSSSIMHAHKKKTGFPQYRFLGKTKPCIPYYDNL